MESLRYFRIPIPFIPLILTNPKAAEEVLAWCLYWESEQLRERGKLDLDNACKLLVSKYWDEYNQGSAGLSVKLHNICQDILGDAEFSYYDIKYYTEEVRSHLENCDIDHNEVMEWYSWNQVISMFNLESCLSADAARNKYNKYVIDSQIWAYCPKDMLFNFIRKSKNCIPAFEVNQFCCYLAMKSIEGSKDYGIGSKKMIIARMCGLDSQSKPRQGVLSRAQFNDLKTKIDKLDSQRQWERLIGAVTEYRYFSFVTSARKKGYIFSTNLNEDEVTDILVRQELVRQNSTLRGNSRRTNEALRNARKLAQNLAGFSTGFQASDFPINKGDS